MRRYPEFSLSCANGPYFHWRGRVRPRKWYGQYFVLDFTTTKLMGRYPRQRRMVDVTGIEPVTPCLQSHFM